MQAPIVSFKHQRQEEATYLGNLDNYVYSIYQGIAAGSGVTPTDIPAGNKMYSVDVSVNYISGDGTQAGRSSWMLVHLRDGQTVGSLFAATDASNWSTIGLSKGKNQVIKSFITMNGSEDATPRVWNLHVKIPKMWHRIREGDSLLLIFNGDGAGPLAIATRYKSYS